VISRYELERRITASVVHLRHRHAALVPAKGISATRLTDALAELEQLTPGMIRAAHRHLDDMQAGYSPTSGAPPGPRGSVSDRTGESVVAPHDDPDDTTGRGRPRLDPVTERTTLLEDATARLVVDTFAVLHERGTYYLARRIETDTIDVTTIVRRWSKSRDERYCTHCLATNGYRELTTSSPYGSVCRRCGDWRGVNKQLPPKDILEYLQLGKTPPRRLIEKHRAKLPRSVRRLGRAD
jgi:hypothetical protein